MLIYPPEIMKMKKKIEPWETGAGIFKPDTPAEILDLNKKLIEWLKTATDGEQL